MHICMYTTDDNVFSLNAFFLNPHAESKNTLFSVQYAWQIGVKNRIIIFLKQMNIESYTPTL